MAHTFSSCTATRRVLRIVLVAGAGAVAASVVIPSARPPRVSADSVAVNSAANLTASEEEQPSPKAADNPAAGRGESDAEAADPAPATTVNLPGIVARIIEDDAPIESIEVQRAQVVSELRELASDLVGMRSQLDARVWPIVKGRCTTTEAAKLLIVFFRGDGKLPGFTFSPEDAEILRMQLLRLRLSRKLAFALVEKIARLDAKQPESPLWGTWEVVGVHGMGGIAADALELYDPDRNGRRFVVANGTAALNTGGSFWLFNTGYDGPNGIDLDVVVRGNTIYKGCFKVSGDEASLRINPMNEPRPESPDGDPTDGGFVLKLRRAKAAAAQ